MGLIAALRPLTLAAAEHAETLRKAAAHADDRGAVLIEESAARWQALADAGRAALDAVGDRERDPASTEST